MKTKRFHLFLAISTAALAANSGWATTVTKNNTSTMQANATDWSTAPTTTDIGSFTDTLDATNAAGLTLGGDLAIGSLVFTNALAGPVTVGAGGTLTLNTAGTTLDLSAANQDVTLNCNVALGAAQVWNVAAARTLTVGGTLSGGSNLTLGTGTGVVSHAGAGSTVAALAVNGGTLAVTGGDLTATGGFILNQSGTETTGLNVSGGSLTVNGGDFLTGQAGGTYSSTITQTNGAIVYSNTASGQLSLANTSATSTTNLTLSGGTFTSSDHWGAVLAQRGTTVATISGTAVATFQPAVSPGAVGLTLAGQPTANCTLNLDGGTLVVGSIVNGQGAGTLNLNGGTLTANRSTATFMTGLTAANVNAGGAVIDDGGNAITIDQALVHDPALGATVDGGLTKYGTGTLTISGANSYTGATTINTGTLATANYATLGSGMIDIKAAGTYAFSTYGASQPTFSNALSGAGAFTVTGSGGNQSFWSGSFSGYSGTLTINAATAWWASSSANTGNTAMKVNLIGYLGLYSNESNITRTYDVGELTGVSSAQIWGGVPGSKNAITLSVGALGTSTTFAGVIANNYWHEATSTLGLTKVGAGTLTLSGVNTYTGATSVSVGKLIIDGSTAAGSAVSVGAGTTTATPVATLGGTGTIGGSVTLTEESSSGFKNGGVLAPTAAASGTQLKVTGTTTFNTGSIFEWNMSATTPGTDPGVVANSGSYGQLAGTGTISGSNAVFKIVLGAGNAFTDAFWNSDKSWNNVFTGSGATNTLASIFSSISGSGITYASGRGTVAGEGYFTVSGTNTLSWIAVPEPTSALAGLLIGAGLLRRRRTAGKG